MNDQNRNSNLGALSDEEIIALYWKREEKAISATDAKYGRYLYVIAYNILRNEQDSEECLNDTYLGTWNAIPPQRPTAFQVFLSKITRNISLGKFRKQTASKRIPPEMVVSLEELDECMAFECGEDEKYQIHVLSCALNKYLHTLSDRKLFIFVCRYYYSDPVLSIAKMLRMSESTVMRELAAIRHGLKEHLEKEGIER